MTSLNISDIRIKLVSKEDSKLKAVASFTIEECFVVHDVKVIDGTNGLFVAMPSKQSPNNEARRDIVHPRNTETREQISAAILAAYEEEKSKESQE